MDDTELDPELAKAMGFSGFGTQPNKKRKFTHNDAVVETAPKKEGSGANNTALGARGKKGVGRPEVVADETRNSAQQRAGGGGGLAGFLARGQQGPNEGRARAHETTGGVVPTGTDGGAAATERVRQVRGGGERIVRDQSMQQSAMTDAPAYFRDSFLEDPWKELRERRGQSG